MDTMAVVLEAPERLAVERLRLDPAGDGDVVVAVEWSGISTGTERLLWSGKMPPFPGMGYPLVPGYESVGRVTAAGPNAGIAVGARVFVPGARCFGPVRGLFGGAAAKLVVPGSRAIEIDDDLGDRGVLLALAATAEHAVAACAEAPDLIVGHGVLGRLVARLAVLRRDDVTVWEVNPKRASGAVGYRVVDPAQDERRDYRNIIDVSGDVGILDRLMPRLAKGGEIVLAGFYAEPLSFAFPPAFMREARIKIAAEWAEVDLVAVRDLVRSGRLSLDGLITHRRDAADADAAYRTAFGDPECLKMTLDWRACS
ncbi:MAG: chlorophyll synthesis pathway protein BchC [Geminicoccaceae bacterium]